MAKTTSYAESDTRRTRRLDESEHSHIEYGSTRGNWDRGASTDFAITTVNVPDRLDTQEVRAKAADQERGPSVRRIRGPDIVRAATWLVLLGLVGGLIWLGVGVIGPVREATSPSGVALQMSRAFGAPVSVRETQFRFLPSPRLIVTDAISQSGFRLPEVTVHFNWRDVLNGLRSATWLLGEASVAPAQFTGAEALSVLDAIRGASGLPGAVSTVRFESVEFPGLVLLPGRYEAVIRRGLTQREFNGVTLRRLDADGQFEMEITPPAQAGGASRFALFARKWTPAAGPAVAWSEATAQGEFGAEFLKVSSFSVGAPFGNLNGGAMLNRQGAAWKLTGNVRGPDVNLEELTRFLAAPKSAGEPAQGQMPLRGTARFDLAVAGAGATVEEALQRATASGAGTVAGAMLSGINLGLLATHGDRDGAGGGTRFTDLDFEAVGSATGLTIRNVSGKSGGLRVTGGFTVDRKLQVGGGLRSEVSSPRGTAAAQVRLSGGIAAPVFQ